MCTMIIKSIALFNSSKMSYRHFKKYMDLKRTIKNNLNSILNYFINTKLVVQFVFQNQKCLH